MEAKPQVSTVTFKGNAAMALREVSERLQIPVTKIIQDATKAKLKEMGYTVVD